MRRYPWVVGATAVSLAAVLSFRTPGVHPSLSTQPDTNRQPANGAGSGTTTSTTAPTSTTSPPSTTTVPPRAPSTTTPTHAPPTTTAPATVSADGAAEQYGYGVVSVKVTMTGGRIVAVTVVTLQTAETYSQQLAGQAIPVLRREVLSAQSARIAAVSGATYTSEAYAASVQSALDALHA